MDITIKLKRYNNGASVTMREPKVRDLMAVGQYSTPEEKEMYLVSNLTGLSIDEVNDLYLADYKLLQEKLQSFLS